MIASLRGTLQAREEEELIVDVNGVGYLVATTAAASGSVEVGSKIELLIFTDVKENAISLYGFKSTLEKRVFLLLKRVKGVGSKTALGVLSALGAEALLQAIGRGDVSVLLRVPGIGKKTAERLLLELREQVGSAQFGSAEDGAQQKTNKISAAPPVTIASDTILALERLGFSSDKASSAVSSALQVFQVKGVDAPADPGELLRVSLTHI
jgi:Holliday junction DNA helicase RuvA